MVMHFPFSLRKFSLTFKECKQNFVSSSGGRFSFWQVTRQRCALKSRNSDEFSLREAYKPTMIDYNPSNRVKDRF